MKQTANQGMSRTEDLMSLIALHNHLVMVQDQVIKMGAHLIKVQTRLDQLEKWAEKRGS